MLQTYVAEADTISVLSQEEKAAVDEGIQDLQAGKVVNHQEVKQNTKDRYPHLQPKVY